MNKTATILSNIRLCSTVRWLIWGPLLALFILPGCNLLLAPDGNASVGVLDLDRYVALGDGYTSGVANTLATVRTPQGLYQEAQGFAYPQLLADHLGQFWPISFTQHWANGTGTGYLQMTDNEALNCQNDLIPITELIPGSIDWRQGPDSGTVIQNLGIHQMPLKWIDSDSFAAINPFINRIRADHEPQETYIEMVQNREVSFFTLWLGLEDILPFAVSGGVDTHIMTSATIFQEKLTKLLDSVLTNRTAIHGVIANIPDVTRFPFFRTLSYQYTSLDDCDASPRTIYVTEEDGTIRPATSEDLVLLPVARELGTVQNNGLRFGLHPELPIPHYLVLDKREASLVRATILNYNAIIDQVVGQQNAQTVSGTPILALADMFGLFNSFIEGRTDNGVVLSNRYLTGGVFSLDGLFLTPRGQSVVANQFLQTINETSGWRASIPLISLTDYPGNIFP